MAHLEAGLLDGRHHRAHLVQLAVGEDVAVDEAGPAQARSLERRSADAVVEEAPARSQQPEHVTEVLAQLRRADVLEHADGADRVVGAVGHVPVVLQTDLGPVG